MSDTSTQFSYPKLHNAMWPGLVGKGEEEGQEPPISLERMLDLTAAAEVDGQKFEGVDYFLFHPHTDPDASEDELKRIADLIASHDLVIGSLVAPIWPGTVGDSAMGDDEQQEKFLTAIHKACRIAKVFNDIGIRKGGVIRLDSAEFGVDKWREDPAAGTARIVDTFRKATQISADHGERLAADGDRPFVGWYEAVHGPEQGALARARQPDHHDELAFVDRQVDVAQCPDPAPVGHRDVLKFDHRVRAPRQVLPSCFGAPGRRQPSGSVMPRASAAARTTSKSESMARRMSVHP